MKLKILAKIIEKILGMTDYGDGPRADMYLPEKLLAFALVLLGGGSACGLYAIVNFKAWAVICAVLGVGFGFFALICWKNQAIRMISDEEFTYTTMFGNTYTYAFSDIQGLRRNQDSLTLFVANKKVHIESMAVISDRLADRIDHALRFDEKAIQLSHSELLQLSDDELFNAIMARTESLISSKADLIEGFRALNEEQQIFYALNYLEMEVNNGGLCQFFVNSSRGFASLVSGYMETVGATEHKKLYDSFIQKHQINTSDLSSFDCDNIEAFQDQYARYPFEEYDDAFYELEPLQTYLVSYIKKYIEKF